MQLLRFTVYKLQNKDWFRFHTEFGDFVMLCGTDVLEITRLYPPYRMLYKEADRLFDMLRNQPTDADIAFALRQRDGVFLGLRDTVKFLQKDPDTEKQFAALKTYAVIDKYTDIVRKGSPEEKTAAADALLHDLMPDKGVIDLSPELHLLELNGWLADLEAIHITCKQSQADNEKDKDTSEAEHLKQVRTQMDHYYTNMMNVIDARLLTVNCDTEHATSDEKLLRFANDLNHCITRYKAILKRKTGYGMKKKDRMDRSA
ncbi:MAG: DUF6261 family protein [Tannerellaceae bacterium]|nr:DUF6261 family protein [Tannerellaceae bacterium]